MRHISGDYYNRQDYITSAELLTGIVKASHHHTNIYTTLHATLQLHHLPSKAKASYEANQCSSTINELAVLIIIINNKPIELKFGTDDPQTPASNIGGSKLTL